MMLSIDIELNPMSARKEFFEILFKSFESQGFRFGALPWRQFPNFTLTRRIGRGRVDDDFDWDLIVDENDISIGLEFSNSELEEGLHVGVNLENKLACFVNVLSGQLPRVECRSHEREMALRQQAIAKSLHLGLGAIVTVAFLDSDDKEGEPWFEFSRTRWEELTEEDLPLVAYDEEDIGIAEEIARCDKGRFPPWYEEAKRVVAQRIRREQESGS